MAGTKEMMIVFVYDLQFCKSECKREIINKMFSVFYYHYIFISF